MSARKKAPPSGALSPLGGADPTTRGNRSTPKPKRTSGPTQAESDRANPQTLLRLRPEVRAAIVDAAARAGTSMSTIVELAWSIAVAEGQIERAIAIATKSAGAREAAAAFFGPRGK